MSVKDITNRNANNSVISSTILIMNINDKTLERINDNDNDEVDDKCNSVEGIGR